MILIVDDYADTRLLLSIVLKQHGYASRGVATGREAIESLYVETPRLVLLDHSLPDMDGITLVKTMRATPGMEGIPMVLYTGNGQVQDEALRAGVDEVVVKASIDLSDIVAVVRRLIGEPVTSEEE